MLMALLFQFSPPPRTFTSIRTTSSSSNSGGRCENRTLMLNDKHLTCKENSVNLRCDMKAISEAKQVIELEAIKKEIPRRDLLLHAFWGLLPSIFAVESGIALDSKKIVEEPDYTSEIDEINAYTFSYPIKVPNRQYKLKWVESRKPERYSSAAPLSADARQRIVSERLDIKDNLVISVSIGPPNSRILTSKDKNSWDARNVAESVLADKSTARLTTGQRVQETSISDAHGDTVAGEPYWYYEYIAQKSPTVADQKDVFRRSVAVTAERDGYLYSLNASALSSNWNMMEPLLRKTISSFRLLPATENYVPPFKDPWKFW